MPTTSATTAPEPADPSLPNVPDEPPVTPTKQQEEQQVDKEKHRQRHQQFTVGLVGDDDNSDDEENHHYLQEDESPSGATQPNNNGKKRKGHHQDSMIERATKVSGLKLKYLFIIMFVLTILVLVLFFILMETQLNDALIENGIVTTRIAAVGLKEKAIDFMSLGATSGETLLATQRELEKQFPNGVNTGACDEKNNTLTSPPTSSTSPTAAVVVGSNNEGVQHYLQNVTDNIAFTINQLLLCSDSSFMGLEHFEVFNGTSGLPIPGHSYTCPEKIGVRMIVPPKSESAIPDQMIKNLTGGAYNAVITQTKEKVLSFIPTGWDLPDTSGIFSNNTTNSNTSSTHRQARMVSVLEWSKERMGKNFFSTSRFPDVGFQTSWDISHMTGAVMMKNYEHFKKGRSTDEFQVLYHTLTDKFTSYAQDQPTTIGTKALNHYATECNYGRDHTWHLVLDTRTMKLMNLQDMPSPQIDRNSFRFNIPASATLCIVLCTPYSHDDEEAASFSGRCNLEDHADAVFYMVVITSFDWVSDFMVEFMQAVYVCATFLICCACFFLHVSIAVPADFLQHKIAATVTSTPWERTKWQQFKYTYSQVFWVGDMKALIKTFNIMADFYYLNRKFVPEHVLNRQAEDIEDDNGSFLDESTTLGVDLEDDHLVTIDGGDSGQNSRQTNDELNNEMISVEASLEEDPRDGGARGGGWGSPHTVREREVSTTSMEPGGAVAYAFPSQPGLRSERSTTIGAPEATPFTSAKHFKEQRASLQQHASSPARPPANRPRHHRARKAHGAATYYDDMSEISEATILAVHLDLVEDAYKIDFSAAELQHRQIYTAINGIIRRYKGEVFHRSGDCFGVAWNAFDTRPDHVMRGTNCALELSNFFEDLRAQGLMMGLAVHQGPIVAGVLTDHNTMSNVVFGKAVDLAMHIAQLGSKLPYFSVMLTEPVKQAVSIFYVCIIIDVIKIEDGDAPVTVFEVRGLNEARSTLLDVKRKQASSVGALENSQFAKRNSTLAVVPSQPTEMEAYVVEYNTAFAKFRAHNFDQALQHLTNLQQKHGIDMLIERLMHLCSFYSTQQKASSGSSTPCISLPKPYCREVPRWALFEDKAANSGALSITTAGLDMQQTLEGSTIVGGSSSGVTMQGSSSPTMSGSVANKKGNSSAHKTSTNTAIYSSQTTTKADFKQELRNAAALKQIRTPTNGTTNSTTPNSSTPNPMSSRGVVTDDSDSVFEDVGASNMSVASKRDSGDVGRSSVAIVEVPSTSPPSSATTPGTARTAADDNTPATTFNDTLAAGGGGATGLSGGQLPDDSLTATSSLRPQEQQPNSVLHGNSIIKSCGSFESISGTINMSLNMNPAQFEASKLPVNLTSNFGVKYIRSENILGRGSYGCVYMGMEEHTGKLIAIKFLPLPDEAEELEKIENEVTIMASIHDHFLVDFFGYSLFDGKIALFQECMVAGPLSSMLDSFSQLPAQTTVNFIKDVLKGLRKLHSNDIIHRDVKPQNVLLTTSGHCKITDFGASASIGVLARQQAQGMILGTPMYLAPEAAKANPCAKSDIWSVGVMFLQLVTGKLPYDITPGLRANAALFVFQIGSGKLRPTIPDASEIGEVTHQFVAACLAEEVDDRSSAEELLEMPFFTV